MSIYSTRQDLIEGEIAPALLDPNGTGQPVADADAVFNALRATRRIVWRRHPGAAQRDGYEMVGSEDDFWAVVSQVSGGDGTDTTLH